CSASVARRAVDAVEPLASSGSRAAEASAASVPRIAPDPAGASLCGVLRESRTDEAGSTEIVNGSPRSVSAVAARGASRARAAGAARDTGATGESGARPIEARRAITAIAAVSAVAPLRPVPRENRTGDRQRGILVVENGPSQTIAAVPARAAVPTGTAVQTGAALAPQRRISREGRVLDRQQSLIEDGPATAVATL